MEAVIAFKAQTRVGIGGPKADLFCKANLFHTILKYIHTTHDIRVSHGTKKVNYTQLFDPRHLRCARDITGVWLQGISRRPLWPQHLLTEEIIAYNLALARQHFNQNNLDKVQDMITKHKGKEFGKKLSYRSQAKTD